MCHEALLEAQVQKDTHVPTWNWPHIWETEMFVSISAEVSEVMNGRVQKLEPTKPALCPYWSKCVSQNLGNPQGDEPTNQAATALNKWS